MIRKIRFPKFDANITEGMIGVWRKEVGEALSAGEPMVEIITDKATFDLEAETEGRLKAIIAKEKSVVPVGYIIALAGEDGDALPDVAEENEKIMAEHRQTALDAKPTGGAREALGAVGGRAHVRAVPAARRLAKEAGIDIANVPPSNGSPVITEEDVKRYLASTSGKGGAP